MRNSLKQKLNQLIRLRGQISYQEIKQLVESGYFGKRYRMSTAERRLRSSESPNVKAEGDPITSYQWIGEPPKTVIYKVVDNFGNVEKILTISK